MVDLRELEMRDLEGRVAAATASLSGRQDKNKDVELELAQLRDENKQLIDENKVMKNWLQTLIRLVEQHDGGSPNAQGDITSPVDTTPAAPPVETPPTEAAATPDAPPNTQPTPSPSPPPDVPATATATATGTADAPTPDTAVDTVDAMPAVEPASAPADATDANLVAAMRSQHTVDYNQVVENEEETKGLLSKIKMRLNTPSTPNA